MPKKRADPPDEEVLDLEALNALVERVQAFIDGNPDLSGANQEEKAKAVGLTDQKAFSRLINKKNALTLTTVTRIAEKLGLPVWRLVMPKALDDGLKSLGFHLDGLSQEAPSPKKEPTPKGRAQHGAARL